MNKKNIPLDKINVYLYRIKKYKHLNKCLTYLTNSRGL